MRGEHVFFSFRRLWKLNTFFRSVFYWKTIQLKDATFTKIVRVVIQRKGFKKYQHIFANVSIIVMMSPFPSQLVIFGDLGNFYLLSKTFNYFEMKYVNFILFLVKYRRKSLIGGTSVDDLIITHRRCHFFVQNCLRFSFRLCILCFPSLSFSKESRR